MPPHVGRYRFEPRDRMLLLPIGTLDTLDYTSYTMHLGSKLVLDATGQFLDPGLPADHDRGSLRGHIAAGARKVVLSAPLNW